MRKSTKIVAAVGGAALVVATAGTAYAYWTASGTGAGTAATGTVVGITVNQSTVVTGLYPGGPAVPLSGTFTNTNPGKVYVASVSATIPAATLPSGCVAADFTIGGSAPVGAEVASGTGVGSWSGLTIKMNDTGDNQDACKPSALPIAYTSN